MFVMVIWGRKFRVLLYPSTKSIFLKYFHSAQWPDLQQRCQDYQSLNALTTSTWMSLLPWMLPDALVRKVYRDECEPGCKLSTGLISNAFPLCCNWKFSISIGSICLSVWLCWQDNSPAHRKLVKVDHCSPRITADCIGMSTCVCLYIHLLSLLCAPLYLYVFVHAVQSRRWAPILWLVYCYYGIRTEHLK